MSSSDNVILEVTPQVLLKAYSCGIFPMADSADDPAIFWVEPKMRGILPLDGLHISRSLAKARRKNPFEIKINTAFETVVDLCAQQTPQRTKTWINDTIRRLYVDLHEMGYCHSVEAWRGEELLGGLYGVSIGGAFFGESMFSRADNASKICLVHLVEHMNARNFALLDTQFTTPHLESMGVIEVPKEEYSVLLETALKLECQFT